MIFWWPSNFSLFVLFITVESSVLHATVKLILNIYLQTVTLFLYYILLWQLILHCQIFEGKKKKKKKKACGFFAVRLYFLEANKELHQSCGVLSILLIIMLGTDLSVVITLIGTNRYVRKFFAPLRYRGLTRIPNLMRA